MMGGPAGVWSPTSAGGPCFMCGLNNAALYGLQPMGNSLANMEVQSETSYLAGGGVPWYGVSYTGNSFTGTGGDLMLLVGSSYSWQDNPDWNPQDPDSSAGTGYQSALWADLGPVANSSTLTYNQVTGPLPPNTISAYRPPIATVSAAHPPVPGSRPGAIECITNPGDSLEAMAPNANQPGADPEFPSLIYANRSGRQQLNPEGDAVGAGVAVIMDYLLAAGGCLMGR